MCRLCYSHQNVPESAKIVNCYDRSMDSYLQPRDASDEPTDNYDHSMSPLDVYYTSTASVSKGAYRGLPVAVHVSRQPPSGSPELTLRVSSIVILDLIGDFFLTCDQKFCKEAVIWRHLRHPNVVPLVGVTISPDRCSLVSDWTDNGTILRFIRKNPDANRIDLVGWHVILVSQRLTCHLPSLSMS